MSGNQSAHPARDILAAYGLGKLQGTEAEAVESHITECEECCETLLDLGSDTFVELVGRSDAVQLDGAEETTGSRETHGETTCELPEELLQHPRYRVLELLGKGGMGNVYKARHSLMNRTVALKVINRELVQNAQAVERFRREVQSAAQLAHSNIVTAYDAEQAGGMHLLVMEYVPGDNLSNVVKGEGPLKVDQACDYIRQAAQGLQHAHEHGMVHRDVKPHNLMVTEKGEIKILDFGLATLARESITRNSDDVAVAQDPASNLTSVGSIMGTPDFISPEQGTDASAADVRSDIYSLGCTFYYLLTGRPPFSKGTALERIQAHSEQEAESIESVRDDIPRKLAEILRRMMAKDPSERFQSPAEIAEALVPFVDAHRTTPVVSSGNIEIGNRSWWPPTVVQTVALAAFALIVAGIIYVTTDNGTLVIDADDNEVEVVIRSGDGVRIIDRATGSTIKRLPTGEYVLDLKRDKNDFELNQQRFVLKRGSRVVASVTRTSRKPGSGDTTKNVQPMVAVRQVWHDSLDDSGDVAPNRRYVSFVDWETGDLALRDLLLNTNRRLTNKGTWDTSDEFAEFSEFAPDSKQLAYTWYNENDAFELRIIDVQDGQSQVVYANAETNYVKPMDWSPDGARILAVLTAKDQTNQIALISVADKSVRILKSLGWRYPGEMQFSPDGKFIAYDLPPRDDTLKHDLFVIDTNGTTESNLVEHPSNDAFLGWSPDGRWLLFASNRTRSWGAWIVGIADGKRHGEPRLIKPDIGDVVPLGLASDGSFYFAAGSKVSEICTATFDPQTGEIGPANHVTQNALGVNFAPGWSDNGDLAYLSQRSVRGQRRNIIILTADDQERQVASRLSYITPKPPAWSPDGRSLLVSGSDVQGRGGMFIVNIDTGHVERVVRGNRYGEWSPDGKALYVYRPGKGDIYRLDLKSQEEREVVQTDSRRALARFVISPDGDSIAFTTYDEQKQSWVLRRMPIAGGDTIDLYEIPNERWVRRLQWTADNENLLIGEVMKDGGEHKFSFVPLQGGTPRELQLKLKGVEYVKMHPSGKQLAMTITNEGASEINVLENFLPPLEDSALVEAESTSKLPLKPAKNIEVLHTGSGLVSPNQTKVFMRESGKRLIKDRATNRTLVEITDEFNNGPNSVVWGVHWRG